MKKGKQKKVLTYLGASIVVLLLFYFSAIIIKFSNKNLYKEFGSTPIVSTNSTFEVERTMFYYYTGDDAKLNVKALKSNEDLNLNFYTEDEDVIEIDEQGNIKALKEGKATVVVENGYDDYSLVEVRVVNPEYQTIDEAKKVDFEIKKVEEKEKAIENKNKPTPEPTPSIEPLPTDTPEEIIEEIIEEKDINSGEVVIPLTPPVAPPVTPIPTPTPTPTPSDNPVKPITIDPEKPSIVENKIIRGYTNYTYQIVLSETKNNDSVTYLSSNPKVLTVNSSGLVKFISPGSAYVTVTNGTKTNKISFNVTIRNRIHFISHVETTDKSHVTGDAILLESNGYYAMIDMGNTTKSSRENIISYLKDNNVQSLDFVLFTHMHGDHAANLQYVLEAGIRIKNIWMKNYDVESYRDGYIPNLNEQNIDVGIGKQNSKNNPKYELNMALARFKRIKYLAEYSKYSDMISKIRYVSSDPEGNTYTFKNLKFTMTLYNNTRNKNAQDDDNWNSILSLIEVNGHKVLLTGDAYDTLVLNQVAEKIGKVDVFKLPHHGSRRCALIRKRYDGDRYSTTGSFVYSTSLDYLKPQFFIITSSKKKINNIRKEYNVNEGGMCVDYITSYSNNYKYYVDEAKHAVVVDLSTKNIFVESK